MTGRRAPSPRPDPAVRLDESAAATAGRSDGAAGRPARQCDAGVVGTRPRRHRPAPAGAHAVRPSSTGRRWRPSGKIGARSRCTGWAGCPPTSAIRDGRASSVDHVTPAENGVLVGTCGRISDNVVRLRGGVRAGRDGRHDDGTAGRHVVVTRRPCGGADTHGMWTHRTQRHVARPVAEVRGDIARLVELTWGRAGMVTTTEHHGRRSDWIASATDPDDLDVVLTWTARRPRRRHVRDPGARRDGPRARPRRPARGRCSTCWRPLVRSAEARPVRAVSRRR